VSPRSFIFPRLRSRMTILARRLIAAALIVTAALAAATPATADPFHDAVALFAAGSFSDSADAVSQLAGGGSTSLLETLRSNLGVDDLDISTDETGQTTVSVGRYLNNRTYLQVEQGGSGGAQATINLDVGRGVKLKAGAGTEGGTAGIFYEHEY